MSSSTPRMTSERSFRRESHYWQAIYNEFTIWYLLSMLGVLFVPILLNRQEDFLQAWIFVLDVLIGILCAVPAAIATLGALLDRPAKQRFALSFIANFAFGMFLIFGIRFYPTNKPAGEPDVEMSQLVITVGAAHALVLFCFSLYRKITRIVLTTCAQRRSGDQRSSKIAGKQLSLKYLLNLMTFVAIGIALLKSIEFGFAGVRAQTVLGATLGMSVFVVFTGWILMLCIQIALRNDFWIVCDANWILLCASILLTPLIIQMLNSQLFRGPIAFEMYIHTCLLLSAFAGASLFIFRRLQKVGLRVKRIL